MTTSTPAQVRAIRSRREQAFTLLEMIVVMILLGIATAATFPTIISLFKSSTRAAAYSGATGDSAVVERIIERDIRSAAGARSMGHRGDLTTAASSVVRALNSTDAALHDIREARPRRLVVNADVDSITPGPEIVTWELVVNDNRCGERKNGANWCIIRTVRSNATTTEVLARGRGDFPATIPGDRCASSSERVRLFCYRTSDSSSYVWDSGWSASGCSPTWRNLNSVLPGAGWIAPVRRNGFDPAMQIHQLDLITTVSVSLPSGGGYGATSERTFTTTELTIRSRQGDAYGRAIMCGAR